MDKALRSNKYFLPHHFSYWPLIIVLGIIFGLSAQDFLNFIITSGHLIPQEDMGGDYLVAVITAAILGFSILFWPISKTHKQDLLLVWIIRSILTLGLLVTFESSHYQDAYWYFYDAINETRITRNITTRDYQGGHFFVLLLTALLKIAPDSYHGLKVLLSMMGMLALYICYRCAALLLGKEDRTIFYFLSLFPSLLFWSSVIDKGVVIILGMSIYAYGIINWHKTKKATAFFSIIGGILLMSFLRVWMGAIAAAPLVIFFLVSDIKFLKKMLLFLLSLVGLYFLGKHFFNTFAVGSLEEAFIFLEAKSRSWTYTSGSGKTEDFHIKSWEDIFAFLPLGVFTALFRPFPWELPNLLGILAGLENIFLLLLLSIGFLKTRWRDLKNPIVIWLVLLILTWACVFCFLSYQNFGTAIRYRAQIQPILLILIVYLTRKKSSLISTTNNP